MDFSRQKYWSGLPFPTPGDLSDPEIKTESLASPSLAGGFFTIESCGKHHSWHRIIPGTSIFKTNWHHQVQSVTSPSRVSWNPQVFAHSHCPRLSWRPSQPLCYVNLYWVSTVCTLHSDPFSTPLCSAGCITQGPWACWLLMSWPLVGLGRRSGNKREIQCSYCQGSLPAGSYSSTTTVATRWPSSAAPSCPRLQEWHCLLPLPLQH